MKNMNEGEIQAVVKGVGNFFYKYFMYSFIYLATYFFFFIFKVRYIKEYPFKSLITLGFIIGLEFMAFGN